MLMAQPSTYDNFQTCHMLTAQPTTYDIFALIELYGRKVHSVVGGKLILFKVKTLQQVEINYLYGFDLLKAQTAVNIFHWRQW